MHDCTLTEPAHFVTIVLFINYIIKSNIKLPPRTMGGRAAADTQIGSVPLRTRDRDTHKGFAHVNFSNVFNRSAASSVAYNDVFKAAMALTTPSHDRKVLPNARGRKVAWRKKAKYEDSKCHPMWRNRSHATLGNCPLCLPAPTWTFDPWKNRPELAISRRIPSKESIN